MPFFFETPALAKTYFSTAFDFGRHFDQQWSVNWQGISSTVFDSSRFHLALMVGHVSWKNTPSSQSLALTPSTAVMPPSLYSTSSPCCCCLRSFDGVVDQGAWWSPPLEVCLAPGGGHLGLPVLATLSVSPLSPSHSSYPRAYPHRIHILALLFRFADVPTVLFTSNLIGILFARSLHYQFYAWYAHTIPFLLWITGTSWMAW